MTFKISVFTSTRAEYGLLSCLIKKIDSSPLCEIQLIVAGTHLSHEHGYTIDHIIADGVTPFECISNLISDDSPQAITRSSALLSISLADYFSRESPDFFVVLGDRVELLAACEAATIAKVPIVHIHGGEKTEGAVDDKIRHAVTKLSSLHFTSTEDYRRRVIQLGAHPDTVINCGALGLEVIDKISSSVDFEPLKRLGLSESERYFLVIYHPETTKDNECINGMLNALSEYPEIKKVILYPNSDIMSHGIVEAIDQFSDKYSDQVILVKSLPREHYISLMANCFMYIGNSSSGIIEMPCFKKPIINIGDRQKGRIRSAATIDVNMNSKEIIDAIKLCSSECFLNDIASIKNPYEGSQPSSTILDSIISFHESNTEYGFFDLEYEF